ncbi:protein Flattop isoform X2 [Stigmatopora nigra]
MSSRYSANQYDDAFNPKRLQNWCLTKPEFKAPTARKGCTKFVADNNGHLLPGTVKKGSAWPEFKGTWDLPARIPVQKINPTSRSVEGIQRLRAWGLDPDVMTPGPPRGSKITDASPNPNKKDSKCVLQNEAISSSVRPSTAESQTASQSRPVTADSKTGKHRVKIQAEGVSSVTSADKPESQRAMSSLRPTTGESNSK